MDETNQVALVVAYDREVRSTVGAWLEGAGFEVCLCPGPLRPDYRCIADRAIECPLARSADLVVLDAWLESDADDAGTTSPELIRYYRSLGMAILVLDHAREGSSLIPNERIAVLEWPPDRSQIETYAAALA
jgi:hypothetical protein